MEQYKLIYIFLLEAAFCLEQVSILFIYADKGPKTSSLFLFYEN